jgi:hypothetical protein
VKGLAWIRNKLLDKRRSLTNSSTATKRDLSQTLVTEIKAKRESIIRSTRVRSEDDFS